mgnify:CR=1 FL=1
MPEEPAERVFIAAGSNIRPEENILKALELLKQSATIKGMSTVYQTPAIGRPEQADYLNGVWEISTGLEPEELKFELLRDIEKRLGRRRSEDKYAARTMDLDILLYGQRVIDKPDMKLPDPDLCSRVFLAAALLELAPDLILPDSGKPLSELPVLQSAENLQPCHEFTKRLRKKGLRNES